MKRKTTLEIGVVSEGTLKTDDLLDAFLYAANSLRLSKSERAEVRRIERLYRDHDAKCLDPNYDREQVEELEEDLGEAINECLPDILNNHALSFCYFGTLEGDGACFGAWPDWELLDNSRREGGVAERRETATPLQRYAAEVNDHGNTALWRRSGKRWIEVWSTV